MSYLDISLPGERWKPVVGFERQYMISTVGRVWSLIRGRCLSEALDRKGYPRVSLRGRTRKVHHLVLEAFTGPRPPGHECAHLDGNPSNPRDGNLAWKTPKENHAQKRLHGTHTHGFSHPPSKLSETDVREIRRLRAAGLQWGDIAKRFPVGRTTVLNAGIGNTYGDFEPETICATDPVRAKPKRRPANGARDLHCPAT